MIVGDTVASGDCYLDTKPVEQIWISSTKSRSQALIRKQSVGDLELEVRNDNVSNSLGEVFTAASLSVDISFSSSAMPTEKEMLASVHAS